MARSAGPNEEVGRQPTQLVTDPAVAAGDVRELQALEVAQRPGALGFLDYLSGRYLACVGTGANMGPP
ncbi:hypothetical protein G6O69_28145 [Pseudenhygromyxa sp. WMMC2535]|uniref:hypothetical protein n=1 Tax=Pseudenhygromyxa sp. WMMC2535 TaxID=2712867 RepID=UPI0015959EAB|nr:hypothetical protein [Pseudenhygromyxa sp. WMMC2535]NVB41738.1 hypothetical protein [Pseudenhygromyxa sp. WMMC2535]